MAIDYLDIATSFKQNISVINDPFLKDKLDRILICGSMNSSRMMKWYALITLKNGNTTGEHKTEYFDDFDGLSVAIKQVLQSLK